MFKKARPVHRILPILLLMLPAAAAPALADDDNAATLPSDESLERSGALIGEVRIQVNDIFDPEQPDENRMLFRMANRLHRTTRPAVIAEQLLFKTGDPYSRRILDESERLLRKDRYFYDVQIRPVRYHDNQVDVDVITHDVWTLKVGVGLGRSGGVNTTHFQLQDSNLLGTGKSLTLEQTSNVDRTGVSFDYYDQTLLGTRARLGLTYADNSDGRFQRFSLERPFYSLDTRWAAGLTTLSDDRVDTHYELGHITDRFRHQEDEIEVLGGRSDGLSNGWVHRWSTGFTWQRNRFSLADGFAPSSFLPPDRTLSYPWISYDLIQDSYAKTRDFDQIKRTEDLHLGSQLHLRLGLATNALGSTEDAAVFDANASTGWKPGANHTVLLSSDLSGRYGRDGAENVVLSGGARYYWRDFGEQLFFATLEGAAGRNLDPESQLLLGGDNGLRGYPLRYQDGDASLLLTLEQRIFTDYYPYRLIHVGGAAFFDVGRTWGGGASELGLLKDVGVGLRLSSSRSGLGSIIHIDLAFPLDGDPSIKRTQWLVTTKTSF
jgi:hypothetical protein